MAEQEKQNITQEYNVAKVGLNMDLAQTDLPKGSVSYAINAAVENFDSNGISYQNEEGNTYVLSFPENYLLIGTHFISERNKHIFFLATEDAKSTPKIILPVTLYDVVGKGRYKHRSNDAQCLNGYYPAYQGKEIVVHDSIETRKVVHRKILSFGLERLRYSVLSNMELQSLKFLTGIGA